MLEQATGLPPHTGNVALASLVHAPDIQPLPVEPVAIPEPLVDLEELCDVEAAELFDVDDAPVFEDDVVPDPPALDLSLSNAWQPVRARRLVSAMADGRKKREEGKSIA